MYQGTQGGRLRYHTTWLFRESMAYLPYRADHYYWTIYCFHERTLPVPTASGSPLFFHSKTRRARRAVAGQCCEK